MVGQLQRSVARRKLTKLSSETIIAFLQTVSTANDVGEILFGKYTMGCKLALACSTESLTGLSIPVHLMSKGNVLELFDGIEAHKNVFQSLPETSILSTYISENKQVLSEEDLGGISELFTGHQATWDDGVVKLVHNPKRRGTGKIYTPYDVTAHMSSSCSEALLSRSDSIEELYSKTILDPAVGSGAFCSQLVRVLWAQASKRWEGLDEAVFRRSVCEQMIHACDIDLEALLLAKVVLWISAGCPENGLGLNLSHGDSLGAGPCTKTSMWFDHTHLPPVEGYDCVVGNPPYVRVKPELIGKFVFKNTRNLYCAFVELGQSLLNDVGILCLIVPQGIVNSNETQSLRQSLIGENASVAFQIFDSVPDFLFDQGKIDANTNTNINQRTTIITIDRNKTKELLTSPLLRWRRRKERNDLFQNLSCVKVEETDLHKGRIPMLANDEDLTLFKRMKEINLTVEDVISADGVEIHLPKAIRYFVTALNYNLGRPNTLLLKVDKEHAPSVRMMLNSNLFYWWWRVMGNGFQVEMKDVKSFPVFDLDQKKVARFHQQLVSAEEECKVFKRNAGKDIPNINFNFRQDLLQKIDKFVLESINMNPHNRVFGCKTNSLHGDMSDLRGYISSK